MGYGMRNFFIFGNMKSTDFGTWLGGSGTFGSPSRDVTEVTVPGRNGTLTIDNGRFNNFTLQYDAFIQTNFEKNFQGLKAALLSQNGYQRLEDTFHPEYYRKARALGDIEPDMWQKNRAGSFPIKFDCDPRMFLKSGDEVKTYTANGKILNPMAFASKPFLRVYGTGTLTLGNYAIVISSADTYTDIDLETMNAYKGSTNKNPYVTIPDDACIEPGEVTVALSGITKVEIIPRWWTI